MTELCVYYTHQCPFTAKYVPLVAEVAKTKGILFKAVRFETMEEAQNTPAPFTSYSHSGMEIFLQTKFFLIKSLKKSFLTKECNHRELRILEINRNIKLELIRVN